MNSPDIVETMLEAQYMRLIARCLADVYGEYTFQFYKPSAQQEAFVGFDQGWIRVGDVGATKMFNDIRAALASPSSSPTWYWAFFLQFKRVERVTRK